MVVPSSGGISLVDNAALLGLVAGALIIGGGLLARRVIR